MLHLRGIDGGLRCLLRLHPARRLGRNRSNAMHVKKRQATSARKHKRGFLPMETIRAPLVPHTLGRHRGSNGVWRIPLSSGWVCQSANR